MVILWTGETMFALIKDHYIRLRYRIKYKEKMGNVMMYYGKSKGAKKENLAYKAYLDHMSQSISANDISIDQLIDYLIDRFAAKPYKPDTRTLNQFYLNAVQSKNQTNLDSLDGLLEHIHQSDRVFKEFASKINTNLKQDMKDHGFEPHFYRFKIDEGYAEIDLEGSTDTLGIKCIDHKIASEIILKYGVSEEDIRTQSIRFIRYARALSPFDGLE